MLHVTAAGCCFSTPCLVFRPAVRSAHPCFFPLIIGLEFAVKHLSCLCSRHCRDSAESTATFRNSLQICRPLRTRYLLTRHAVRSVCCAHRVWSAMSVVGLDLSRAFCIDIFSRQCTHLTRHSFLIFIVFHHQLQQFVCLVFRLAVRSAHLFFMLRRGARRASSDAWISFAARKVYHLAVCACWNQSSTKNRATEACTFQLRRLE